MKQITLNHQQIQPAKIICIGRNYVEHIAELNNETATEPVIFIKPNSAISSTINSVANNSIHYESEISFIVQDNKLIAVGFGLDLTKRDIQTELKNKGLPWERAKAFDGAAVFSNFVSFTGDIDALKLELYINNELIQSGGVDLMLYKPNEILLEIASFLTINNNDIIMTGTPKGVGEIKLGDKFVGKILNNKQVIVEQTWVVL